MQSQCDSPAGRGAAGSVSQKAVAVSNEWFACSFVPVGRFDLLRHSGASRNLPTLLYSGSRRSDGLMDKTHINRNAARAGCSVDRPGPFL